MKEAQWTLFHLTIKMSSLVFLLQNQARHKTDRLVEFTIDVPNEQDPEAFLQVIVTSKDVEYDEFDERHDPGTNVFMSVAALYYPDKAPDTVWLNSLVNIRMRMARGDGYSFEEVQLVEFDSRPGQKYLGIRLPGIGTKVLVAVLDWAVGAGIMDEYTVVGLYADGKLRGKNKADLAEKVYKPLGFVQKRHQVYRSATGEPMPVYLATVGQILTNYYSV